MIKIENESMLLQLMKEIDEELCKKHRTVPSNRSERDQYQQSFMEMLKQAVGLDEHYLTVKVNPFHVPQGVGAFVRVMVDQFTQDLQIGMYLSERSKALKNKEFSKTLSDVKKSMGIDTAPPVPPKLIDGLTPDECLARYTLNQREMPSNEGRYQLTRLQLIAARALWSHDVRVKVRKTDVDERERDRLQVVVDFEVD